jgi:hypothetical protein
MTSALSITVQYEQKPIACDILCVTGRQRNILVSAVLVVADSILQESLQHLFFFKPCSVACAHKVS